MASERFERRQVDRHVEPSSDIALRYLVGGEVPDGGDFYRVAEMAKLVLIAPMSSTASTTFERLWGHMRDMIEEPGTVDQIQPPLSPQLVEDIRDLSSTDEAMEQGGVPSRDERALAVLINIGHHGILGVNAELVDTLGELQTLAAIALVQAERRSL